MQPKGPDTLNNKILLVEHTAPCHEKDEIPDSGKIENRRSVLMGQVFASSFFFQIPFLGHSFPCS